MRSVGAISRGFILPNGEVARKGTQHDDIAMEYICDQKLQSQYNKSKYNDLCDFMVYELKAIKVGCNKGSNPKIITYVKDLMIPEQWAYIEYYQSQGYHLDAL